jgi:hypothetical protein
MDHGAAGPVLAEQRRGAPGSHEAAAHPEVSALFGRLADAGAGVTQALAAYETFAPDTPPD